MSDNHQPSAAKPEDQFPDYLVADYVFGDLDYEDRRRVEERMVRDARFLQEVMEMQGTVELLAGVLQAARYDR
jgi:anti-sigma-K factor RskA